MSRAGHIPGTHRVRRESDPNGIFRITDLPVYTTARLLVVAFIDKQNETSEQDLQAHAFGIDAIAHNPDVTERDILDHIRTYTEKSWNQIITGLGSLLVPAPVDLETRNVQINTFGTVVAEARHREHDSQEFTGEQMGPTIGTTQLDCDPHYPHDFWFAHVQAAGKPLIKITVGPEN